MYRLLAVAVAALLFSVGCDLQSPSVSVEVSSDFTSTNLPWYTNVKDSWYVDDHSRCENKDTVFYVAELGIVELDKTSGAQKLIVTNKDVDSLQLCDKSLYYCVRTDGDQKIFCMNLVDGHTEEVLDDYQLEDLKVFSGNILGWFSIFKDRIYTKNTGTSMVVYDMSSKTAEEFAPDISAWDFLNDYFYYTDHGERTFSIYRKNLNTQQIELLRGDGRTKGRSKPEKILYDRLIAVGNDLFYSTRNPVGIYRYDEKGQDVVIKDFSKDETISPYSSMWLASDGEALYYTLKDGSLYKYSPESEEITEVYTSQRFIHPQTIAIIFDVLFYTDADGENYVIPLNE